MIDDRGEASFMQFTTMLDFYVVNPYVPWKSFAKKEWGTLKAHITPTAKTTHRYGESTGTTTAPTNHTKASNNVMTTLKIPYLLT